jgi:membrane protease subunit (stomatin/prohibitin family)
LITAGTNTGVVKEVGEALNNYRYKNQKRGLDVPCIGIASWGYTAENQQLVSQLASPSLHADSVKAPLSFLRQSRNQTVHAIRMVSDTI